MLGTIPLQRAEVIGVTQLGSQFLENSPIFSRALRAYFFGEVTLQVRRYAVIVQQRVVDIEQKYDLARRIMALVHLSHFTRTSAKAWPR
jgi:hypothetical protein